MHRDCYKIIIAALLIITTSSIAHARVYKYQIVNIQSLSRYDETRIVFQHIEKDPLPNVVDKSDNSIACLLIVKDKKIYLFKDGYDDPVDVKINSYKIDLDKKLVNDLWTNKIDDNPDYLEVTERKIEVLRNTTQDYVTKNYKEQYIKWRDEFVKKHVQIFQSLMINRKESGLHVERKQIRRKLYDQGPVKFSTSVSAKSSDDKVYYAEDADGDGLTETFTVSLSDGFSWGTDSGPNVIFIYNCKYKDDEGKDRNTAIKNLIGKLADEAYNGSAIEENAVKKTFPKDSDITEMINDLYQIDPEFKGSVEDHASEK